MQRVKKIWKANGKLEGYSQALAGIMASCGTTYRHATSPGANANPRVSQFDIEKPVIQFAICMITSLPRLRILLHRALESLKTLDSAAVHTLSHSARHQP